MANAGIVYEGVSSSSGGNLFAGKKFWFSRSVPQIKRYQELVRSNGGTVLEVEKHADIRITDPARKDAPRGTYSYKYVEKSIRNGKLENLEDHRVGPPAGAIRPVGATNIPKKTRRVPFSAEDDRILRDWMRPYEKAQGSVSGNKIYEELEAKHPHHTHQSWRDRYIRIGKATRPATPPAAAAVESTEPRTALSQRRSADGKFSSSKATPHRQSKANNGEASGDRRSTESPPQGKRKRDTSPETKRNAKRRQTTYAIAVEIPPVRQDTAPSRASLPLFSRGPSAQLLDSSNFIQSADVASVSKTPPRKEPPRTVSSSHSNETHQTDQFEDAPQFQEKEDTPRQDTAVNLDFDIPPPPPDPTDNYMDGLMKELPFPAIPSNPDETSDDDNNPTLQPANEKAQTLETENWLTSRLKSKKATNEQQLIQALRCCSMEPNLADKVLKSLRAGKGIPGDMRGVWTEEDDECLQTGESRDIERLLEKHGDDFYQKREDYFRLTKEVEKG